MQVGIQRLKVQMKSVFRGDWMEEMFIKDRSLFESFAIGVGFSQEDVEVEFGGGVVYIDVL